MNNPFDSLVVNVPKTYENWPLDKLLILDKPKISYSFKQMYSLGVLPLKWKNYLWYVLHRSNIDQEWFEEFLVYWEKILNGKHLWGVTDFHYLRNLYRGKFTSEVRRKSSTTQHLRAWQEPDSIYTLMHQVNKESLYNQINIWLLVRKYLGRFPKTFLEYGSGIAPITKSFFTFIKYNENVKAYIADIATLSFHYAQFRFAKNPQINSIILSPKNDFLLPSGFTDKIETIFCITVFEHLYDPLEVIRSFASRLSSDGLLVFDYPKSNGGGMDTVNSVKKRDKTLKYIEDKFEIVYGRIRYDQTTTLCIARKK